jgi:hypothetical protein
MADKPKSAGAPVDDDSDDEQLDDARMVVSTFSVPLYVLNSLRARCDEEYVTIGEMIVYCYSRLIEAESDPDIDLDTPEGQQAAIAWLKEIRRIRHTPGAVEEWVMNWRGPVRPARLGRTRPWAGAGDR